MTELNLDFDETESRKEISYDASKIVMTSKNFEEMIRTKLKQTFGNTIPKNDFNESVIRSKYFSELKEEDKINIMVALNIRLALKVAGFYANFTSFNYNHLLEEYTSLAYLGLFKAACKFDFNRKVKFSSFAGKCMHNEIKMFIRKEKKLRQPLYLDEVAPMDRYGKTLEISTYLESIEGRNNIEEFFEDFDRKVLNDELYDFLRTLNDVEFKVLSERFGLLDGIEKSQKEIAKILKCSRPSVTRTEKKAISKLRAYYFNKHNIKPATLKYRSIVVRKNSKD